MYIYHLITLKKKEGKKPSKARNSTCRDLIKLVSVEALKYWSFSTSVSNVINETDLFRFPDVTFCPKFKAGQDLVDKLKSG